MHRGLDGVIADTTSISMVNEATNSLTYHGYAVQDLAVSCSFEEVAYLIWHGELPSHSELASFREKERSLRSVPGRLFKVLSKLPTTCHPMDVLRTSVSYLGAIDPREGDRSVEANLEKSVELMAKLPTIVAFEQRRRRGQDRIDPDPALSFAENFFHMCFGEIPDKEVVECFETSLILYAEHSFNASTFAARVITSTLSDTYSAVTGAIGALKGLLHGGANEAVMDMFNEIGDPDNVASWLAESFAAKRVIMGFGHRIYKHGDSRVPTMRVALGRLAELHHADQLMALYDNLEAAMLAAKDIYPNLDYPSGLAYHLMGFDISTFTPIFVMARITGWTAHIMEQLAGNSLIRPLGKYLGPDERPVPTTRPA